MSFNDGAEAFVRQLNCTPLPTRCDVARFAAPLAVTPAAVEGRVVNKVGFAPPSV